MQDERLCDGAACGTPGCQIPHGYCHCGCGRKVTVPKFVRNHDKRAIGTRYEVDPETGCWLWLGYINHKGYGEMRIGKSMRRAHRVYYEQVKGPIPFGKQLDHLCRVRHCVNPDHLEIVTNFENQRRGRKPKLTEDAIREIRSATPYYGYAIDLARKFNVHPATIYRTRGGRSWDQLD